MGFGDLHMVTDKGSVTHEIPADILSEPKIQRSERAK